MVWEVNLDVDVPLMSLTPDYSSVMHYGAFAFTRNNLPTIQTIDPAFAACICLRILGDPRDAVGRGQSVIGQRGGFSECDVEKLNTLYSCSDKITGNPICSLDQSPPDDCTGFSGSLFPGHASYRWGLDWEELFARNAGSPVPTLPRRRPSSPSLPFLMERVSRECGCECRGPLLHGLHQSARRGHS